MLSNTAKHQNGLEYGEIAIVIIKTLADSYSIPKPIIYRKPIASITQ